MSLVLPAAVRAACLAALLWLLAACESGASLPPTATPPVLSPLATRTVAPPPTPSPAPAVTTTPAGDTAAATAYAALTALAGNDAATATAAAAPTDTPLPPTPGPLVPARALGTYRVIITARAEGFRVYQQPGTLVLSTPAPGSSHAAELKLLAGVRAGHELADLSPGKTVGALVLGTRADLVPNGFNRKVVFNIGVTFDSATGFLHVTADPAAGLPGAWSTGPNNQSGKPRAIAGGTLDLDVGKPGVLSGQIDLSAASVNGTPLAYSGGVQGVK